ncbi:EAL domain-containing protein [Chungangia koreensis]|uniref:EAL domain-containing protein n=1 Tax=Chungangia koreensis TaxID=752657 RepID=A0ABV8X4T8_9LACT
MNNFHPLDIMDVFYRSLFDFNPDLVIYMDLDGIIAKTSKNLTNIFGYSIEEFTITPILNYISKIDQAEYEKNLLPVLNGEAREMEIHLLHENGKLIPTYTTLIPAKVEGNIVGVFAIIKDLTRFKQIESDLLESEAKFRGIVEEALVGVYIIRGHQLLYGNPQYHQILGTKYPENNFDIFDFVHPDDRELLQVNFDSLREGDTGINHNVRVIRKDESEIQIEAHSKLISLNGKPIILGTIIDITDRKKAWEQINFLAYYDPLTKLPNRKSFEEALEKELVIAKTIDQRLAVMYLDLDRFKYINDTIGHNIGDELLKSVSNRLQIVLGEKHFLFRISGDEFAIISPDCKNIEHIIHLARQIVSSMEEQFIIDHYRLSMTTSIGASIFPTDGEDLVTLMKKADAALHMAKGDGKNTYKVYSSTMDIQTYKTFKLGSDIRLALEECQFEYYYQPKVDIETNKIVGAEALLRWNHPEWGLLYPNDFIPIIEENGLNEEVGKKMNLIACKQLKKWHDSGLPQIPISVNLSAKRFFDKNLVTNFQQILDESILDPEFLEIEITETSMLENERIVLATIEGLVQTGISISLDDFGTGFSSLSYLNRFKKYIKTLKIDRSFIMEMNQDKDNESEFIIKTMIQLAENLKMDVVAEGVETIEQCQILKQMGCSVVQGYLFAKPVPASEFEELLKKGTIDKMVVSNSDRNEMVEKRKFFRVPLHFPLSGSMTLTRINGRTVDVGKTVVLIEDIGIGGLRFLTDLKLTVNPNIILEFETYLFGESIKLLGSIVWMNEVKPEIYQYGVQYVIDESERAEITPILNNLAIKLRNAPLVPDCSFVSDNRYEFIRNLRK